MPRRQFSRSVIEGVMSVEREWLGVCFGVSVLLIRGDLSWG